MVEVCSVHLYISISELSLKETFLQINLLSVLCLRFVLKEQASSQAGKYILYFIFQTVCFWGQEGVPGYSHC